MTTDRERAEAAEAERDYWREQATGMAPSVDGMRALGTRLFPGGTGCVVDPERVVAEVDSMLAAFDRIDTEASKRAGEYAESVYGVAARLYEAEAERDATIAARDALRVECERLGAALRMIGQDNAQDDADLARLHALVACEPQAADLHDHTACIIAEVARLRDRVLDAEEEASRWGDALVAIGEAIRMPGRGSAEIVEGVRNLTSLLADIRHAMSEEFNPLDDKPPHVQITAEWARAWAAELERLVKP
jgi:hypothetical protein